MIEYICELEDARYEMEWIPKKEIVRCRDCESYQLGMYEHFTCEYLHQWANPDDFCAWGERKE